MNPADLPAFITVGATPGVPESAPATSGGYSPVWAETESENTNRDGGKDIRHFDIARFKGREALTKFISWAIVNRKQVTIRPKP